MEGEGHQSQSMEVDVYKPVPKATKMEGEDSKSQSMEVDVYKPVPKVTKMEGEDSKSQSMEVDIYKPVPPEQVSWLMNGEHRLYCFADDDRACTSDPEVMQNNIRVPISYAVLNGNIVEMASRVDPRDEFVVSPEYFVELVPQCANLINAIKLKFAKSAKPLKTIDRRELFRVGIHKVFKSKNKLQNLQKYWERSERRRLKREQKQKLKAIEMEKARGSVAKKPEVEKTIVVAKADWFHTVTLASVYCLNYKNYLNDEVLDYGVALAMKRHRNSPDAVTVDVHGWTSYFFKEKHHQSRLSEVFFRRFRKRVPNPLALKYLLIPAVRERHWFLVVVCQPFPDEATVLDLEKKAGGGQNMRDYSKLLYHKWLKGNSPPKILIFDSLVYRSKVMEFELTTFHTSTAAYVASGLLALHKRLWKQTGRSIDFNESVENYFLQQIPFHIMKAPGQRGQDDCGVYVITYTTLWFNELKKVNDNYMEIYRKDFFEVFPYRGCENLRYTLYKIIEDSCSSNPEVLEAVAEHKVTPPSCSWVDIKTEEGIEEVDIV